MGAGAVAIAKIVSAIAVTASSVYSIKRGEEEKGEASKTRKKAKAEAQKKKEMSKTKSPGQRLLGGRPTLG